MLGDKDAVATIPVRDLEVARKFYEDTLGLQRAGSEEHGTLSYRAGHGTVFVYESEHAGTNQATAVTWPVDDVEGTVKELKARGVAFEHYDLPDTRRQGDVHVAGNTRVAWFRDPDGNIHSVAGNAG